MKEERSEGFEEFMKEYNAAEVPSTDNPLNTSKHDLKDQLLRFKTFSHNESESEVIRGEAHLI